MDQFDIWIAFLCHMLKTFKILRFLWLELIGIFDVLSFFLTYAKNI